MVAGGCRESVHEVVQRGPIESIRSTVNANNVHSIDRRGREPLWYACRRGHIDAVIYLIGIGGDPNSAGNATDAFALPIGIAAAHGHVDLVKYLIEQAEVHVDAKSPSGATALQCASGFERTTVVKYLLHVAGSSPNAATSVTPPLHLASRVGNEEIVQLLLESGAEINWRNRYGTSALHEAASRGHARVCQMLLAAGAEGAYTNNWGETALDVAIRVGAADCVDVLSSR